MNMIPRVRQEMNINTTVKIKKDLSVFCIIHYVNDTVDKSGNGQTISVRYCSRVGFSRSNEIYTTG